MTHLTTVDVVSYYAHHVTTERRRRVLADVHHAITTDGAPPSARTLATTHGVAVRTATTDLDALVTAGLLRRLGSHQPRQRARLELTAAGRRLLDDTAKGLGAKAGTGPRRPPDATLSAEHPEPASQATPSLFSHAEGHKP